MILQTKDAALFFKLSWSLLYYVNQKYPVIKGLKSPDLRDRDPEIIMKLHRTFYTHMELIDSFVSENPFELNPEDLGIISSWKKSIKDMFYVISHTRNYTLFLQPGRNPKVYGVLGLYDKIEKFTDELPQAVEALLLPFKGKIIYSGVLHPFPFIFEDRKKKSIEEDYQNAIDKYGIILSLDKHVPEEENKDNDEDEDFSDLIISETGMEWRFIEADLPEMPTEILLDIMVELKLYVNKKIAMEIAKRDDAVFWLRKKIQDGRYWYREDRGSGWTPLHAIHILPLIKSKDALNLLLDTIRYRGDDLDEWVTECVPALLAAFGDNAIEDLKCFSSDETLEPFVRNSATTALAFLASKNPSYQDDIKEHLIELFNDTGDATFASLVAACIASFHDPSVMPQIRRAFEDNRMDEFIESVEELESIIAGEYDDILYDKCGEDPLNHFSRENIEYLHSLNQPEDEEGDSSWFDDDESFDFETDEKTIKKKIGRNDPCPCGSGKKYKKCCMGKEK